MFSLFSLFLFLFLNSVCTWKWMENLQQNEHHKIFCLLFCLFYLICHKFVGLYVNTRIRFLQYHHSKQTYHILLQACLPIFILSLFHFKLYTIPTALLQLWFHCLGANQIMDSRLVEINQIKPAISCYKVQFSRAKFKSKSNQNFIRPSSLNFCLETFNICRIGEYEKA